jgi:hypothetical protein
LFGQAASALEKCAINFANGFYILPYSNYYLEISNDNIEERSNRIYFPHDLSTRNVYGSPPVIWDVSEKYLTRIRLHSDGTGMTFSQILRYQLDSILKYSQESLRQYIDNKVELIDNIGTPLDYYAMQIQFKATGDTSTYGPIYFDFYTNSDTFVLYSYVAYLKKIEVWNFVHFPLKIKSNVSPEIENDFRKRQRWELITSIPIEHPFTGPFRIIHTKGQNYLVTREGEIYLVGTSSLKLVDKLPEGPERTLVIDKDLDEVYHIERALLLRDDDKPLRDKLRESAVQILHDH